VLPDDEPRPAQGLDVLGLVLLSPGLAALIYGLAQVPAHGSFAHPGAYLPAGAGAVLVAAFLWHAARTPDALIDLGLFRDRAFSVATATMVLFMVAIFGSLLLFPLYFQQVRGQGALQAGLLIVPQGIGMMISMPIAGRLVDRGHAARIVPLGIVAVIGVVAVLTRLTDTTPYGVIAAALFVLGLAMGMVGMPNMSIALKTLRPPDIARGSTSLTIIQQCAAAIGTATLSVVLTHEIGSRPAPTPAALAEAYASTFTWALVLLVLALVSALLLPRGGPAAAAPAPADPSGSADS
jgi:predicted MFS family arabinose efflux permease